MKPLIVFFFIAAFSVFGQVKNVKLLANWQDSTLVSNSSQVRYSGCWAFVHDQEEYAILGTTEGAAFFNISAINELVFIDGIQGSYSASQATTREYKTYLNYAYAIGDEGNASLQIIDYSFLPDSVVLAAEIQDERVGKAHTIYIDTANALMYLCAVTPIVNGQEGSLIPLRVFSLSDPLNPILLWEGFDDLNEVHDIEVRDQIAILNCGFDGIRIYDFSNPIEPIYLSNLEFYQEQGYNHQGSLSPDKKTYVFADETPGTRLKECAISEQYELQVQSLFGMENAPYDKTAHNIYTTNNLAYVAYYNDGLRIYDLRTNPPTEIASYDTHNDLQENTFSMWGAWGINASLPSKRILVSDRISGLYLFEFESDFFESIPAQLEIAVYPNPALGGQLIHVRLPEGLQLSFEIRIMDAKGAFIKSISVVNQSYSNLQLDLSSGLYFLQILFSDGAEESSQIQKLVID